MINRSPNHALPHAYCADKAFAIHAIFTHNGRETDGVQRRWLNTGLVTMLIDEMAVRMHAWRRGAVVVRKPEEITKIRPMDLQFVGKD